MRRGGEVGGGGRQATIGVGVGIGLGVALLVEGVGVAARSVEALAEAEVVARRSIGRLNIRGG